ncbi:hypothetical protein LJR225_004556 [Phenylobacterium sp. LjRoot225]|uniref:hypothetical protein n=1 Tax=Phenylobacterium sp. LjRoot225 TaxID=3342285 RepID=UPI003ECD2799
MNALAKTDFSPWSLSEAVVSDLVRKGAHVFDDPLDPTACAALLADIRATRRFDQSLFLSEADFAAAPSQSVERPKPGCNLLERPRLGFVERAPQVVEALWSLLGPDYRILDKRVVCALPTTAVPEWVKRRVDGGADSLVPYVRPEFRDIGYAWGADFRQDLGALSDADADVVTLHLYLHPVAEADGPIRLLEGSHRMGGSAFPHDLKPSPKGWRYRNVEHGEMYVTERTLTGEAGSTALWHACTLNGGTPAGDHPRISLRYLFVRGAAKAAGIDAVNASLAGPASFVARRD